MNNLLCQGWFSTDGKLFFLKNVSHFNSLHPFFFFSADFACSVEPPLLAECRGNTESCSPGLPAASGEIIRCVLSTQSPWPGRGDGSLCPEPERPRSHEQVSFGFSAFLKKFFIAAQKLFDWTGEIFNYNSLQNN